jgi:beta-carotene hydroxylase
MLKYKADIKTLIFLSLTTAMLFVNWHFGFHILTYILSLYLAVTIAVTAHNHNHVPIWKSKFLNDVTDIWITLFYGFPAFAWTPTHNKNHHKLNNRTGDYTITYRYSEKNNVFTLLSYPSISSYFQQGPVSRYFRDLWSKKRDRFYLALAQYVSLILLIGIALLIDWRKAILYIIIPQQFSLFAVLIFNYIQHVHADEESEWNHSRNFVSRSTNWMLFNNGLHTAHHYRASVHWSETPALHAKIAHNIDPRLIESGFWSYIIRAYVLGAFIPKFRTKSMRLDRMAKSVENVTGKSESHSVPQTSLS